MSSEAQVSALSQQLSQPKFSRYRSVRQANRTKQTSSPIFPFQITTACQDASSAESPSRYHRRLNSADTIGEMVAGQCARSAASLHSHSASLAALTGKSYPEFTAQDIQVTPTKTLPKNDAPPPIATRTELIARPTQRSNISPTVASETAHQMPQSCNTTDPIMAQTAVSEKEINENAREKLRAEEERARRIKAKQDAAREFERSGKVALAGKMQSESLANIGGDAEKAGGPISQGKGLASATSIDQQTQRQAR